MPSRPSPAGPHATNNLAFGSARQCDRAVADRQRGSLAAPGRSMVEGGRTAPLGVELFGFSAGRCAATRAASWCRRNQPSKSQIGRSASPAARRSPRQPRQYLGRVRGRNRISSSAPSRYQVQQQTRHASVGNRPRRSSACSAPGRPRSDLLHLGRPHRRLAEPLRRKDAAGSSTASVQGAARPGVSRTASKWPELKSPPPGPGSDPPGPAAEASRPGSSYRSSRSHWPIMTTWTHPRAARPAAVRPQQRLADKDDDGSTR